MASQNQLSRYGAFSRVVPEGVLAPGAKVFLVADSDDTSVGINPADLVSDYPVDADGVVRVYTTIQAAVNACAGGRGDVVLVLPNHVELLNRADSWNVAGVQIIGMGHGDQRAGVRYDTATAEVGLGANGVRVSNLNFLASVDSVARAVDMDSGFFGQKIDHCLFNIDAAGTDEFRVCIRAGARESFIEDNQFLMGDTAGAGRAISLLGGNADHLMIRRNYIYGQYDTVGDTTDGAAPIAIDTTDTGDTNLSGLVIEGNTIVNTDTAASRMILLGGQTFFIRGIAKDNYFASYDSATADTTKFVTGLAAGQGLRMVNNLIGSADSGTERLVNDSTVAHT